jgi:hypothetical protein
VLLSKRFCCVKTAKQHSVVFVTPAAKRAYAQMAIFYMRFLYWHKGSFSKI